MFYGEDIDFSEPVRTAVEREQEEGSDGKGGNSFKHMDVICPASAKNDAKKYFIGLGRSKIPGRFGDLWVERFGLKWISNPDTNGAFIAHIVGEIPSAIFCHHPSLVEIFRRVSNGQS